MTALARWPNVPRSAVVAAAGRCGLPDTWPESRGTGVMPARSARSRATIVADRLGLLSPTALAPFLTPSPVRVADLRHGRIVSARSHEGDLG